MSERAEVQENVIVTKEGHYEFYRESRGEDIPDQTIKPLEFYTTTWIGDKTDMRKKYEDFYARVYANLMFNIFNKSDRFKYLNVNLYVCDPKDKELDSNNRVSTLIEKYGYKIELIISEFKKIIKEKTGYTAFLNKETPYKYNVYIWGFSSIEFSFNHTLPMDGSNKEFSGDVANMFIFDYEYIHNNITNDIEHHKQIETITSQILKVYADKYIRWLRARKLDNILNYIIMEDDKYPRPGFYREFYKLEDKYKFKLINNSNEDIVFNYIKNKNAEKEFMQCIKNKPQDYSKLFNNSTSTKVDCSKMFNPICKSKEKPDYSKWLLNLEEEFDEIQGSEKNVMRRCQLLEMMSAVRQFIKEEKENQAPDSKEKISYPYDLTSIITNEDFLSKNNIVYSNYGWYLIYGTGKGQNLPLNIFSNPSNPKENDIFIVENFVKKEYEILIYKLGKFLFTSDMDKECTLDILKGFEYRGTIYAFELIKTNLIVNKFYRTAKEFVKNYF